MVKFLPRQLRIPTLFFVFLLMLLQGPSTAGGRQSSQQSTANAVIYTDQDSYQIYATLLKREKRSLYVIQAEIDGNPDITRKNLGIKGDEEFLREWGPIMDDYAKQNQSAKLLQRSFPLHTTYRLIPKSNIFPAEHGQNAWEDYYRRYPASGGYYWFSAVGFNPARTRAIVNMGHGCGTLCLEEGPYFFEKKEGKWREVPVNAEVTFWFS